MPKPQSKPVAPPSLRPSAVRPIVSPGERFWAVNLLTLRALVFGFAVLLYANTLGHGYSLDDYLVTGSESLAFKGLSATGQIFTTNYVTDTVQGIHLDYRPLVKFSYALEHQVLGGDVHISHLLNALLYGGVVLLLFNVLLRLLHGYHVVLPLLAAALYAAHPVHTEVVASLKNRDELLSLFFGLLSLRAGWLWATADKTPPAKQLAWMLGFLALSLLSKLNGLLFVGIVPLSVYVCSAGILSQGQALRRAGLLLAAMVGLTALYFTIVFNMLPGFTRNYEYVENPLPTLNDLNLTVGTGFVSLLLYLKLLVLPWPLLSYYGYDTVPVVGVGSPLALMSIALHLGLLAVGFWGLWQRNLWGWLALFYLGCMSMYSNIVYPAAGIVAERSLLVASIPFCVALAYGLLRVVGSFLREESAKGQRVSGLRFKPLVLPLAGVLLLAGTVGTVARNRDWKDRISLYITDLQTQPRSFWLQMMLAKEYLGNYKKLQNGSPEREQMARQTLAQLQSAIAVYPDFYDTYLEAGLIYALELNNLDSALHYFRHAVRTVGKSPTPFQNIGYIYVLQNKHDSAQYYYTLALKRDSTNLNYLNQAFISALQAGDTAAAWQFNAYYSRLQPQSPLVPYNYGSIYMVRGDSAAAAKCYEYAIVLNPNNVQLCLDLSAFYARHHQPDKAQYYKTMAEKAAQQKP